MQHLFFILLTPLFDISILMKTQPFLYQKRSVCYIKEALLKNS